MTTPQEISELIRRRIRELADGTTPDPQDVRGLAVNREMLPLFCDMGGCLAIRPDGEIVSFVWDEADKLRVEGDTRARNIALFQGSTKYPELKSLIKPASPSARECPHCEGTGVEASAREAGMGDGVVCYCGGLGWLP